MYVVLILMFLFLVCDGLLAKRGLRKAMGIKPSGIVWKIGKAIRKAVKAAVRECRETREYTREFHREMREARWEAQEARLEKAGERMDAVLAGIEKCGKKLAQKTAESVREVQAKPEPLDYESLSNRDLVDDLERDARTAAMVANVPTIQFPEEDDKYFSARKYESADD